MSAPSIILKRNPVLAPREWESSQFLQIGSWPEMLAQKHGPNSTLSTRSSMQRAKEKMIEEMKSEVYRGVWVNKLQIWTEWCLGDHLAFEDAVNIFVEVTFRRHVLSPGNDKLEMERVDLEVFRYLEKENEKHWQKEKTLPPPPKVGFFRNNCSQLYDANGHIGDNDFVTSDGNDTSDEDDTDKVDRPIDSDAQKVKPRKWQQLTATDHASWEDLCISWKKALTNFFLASAGKAQKASMVDLTVSLQQLIPLREDCKQAISAMRSVPASVYKKEEWRMAMWNSGLTRMMWNITRPGFIYQLHQNVIDTRNSGVWRDIIGELLHRWTPGEAFKTEIPLAPGPLRSKDPDDVPDVMEFLELLCKHPDVIPNAGNCFSVFFLHDMKQFCECWDEWLLPGLVSHGFTHPETIETLPDILCCIIQNTLAHKRMVKTYEEAVFHQHEGAKERHLVHTPVDTNSEVEEGEIQEQHDEEDVTTTEHGPRTCPFCDNLDSDTKCIRSITVHEHPVGKTLKGCVMTFAPKDQRAKSKFPYKTTYRSPDDEDLQFSRITHRREVLERCGRDVTILIDAASGLAIGGVSYGCFTNEVLQAMIASHNLVTQNTSVRRGKTFHLQASGKMVPVGARIPQGGAPGDGYAPYAHVKADSIQAINALMAHGRDADLMQIAFKPYNSSIASSYRAASAAAGLSRLGGNGVNMYYCTNYMAPIHPDDDVGISLCCQLEKRGGADTDLDFVYARHGVYIETRANTGWWFYSEDLHGSIVPAISTGTLGIHAKDSHATVASGIVTSNLDVAENLHGRATPGVAASNAVVSHGCHQTVRRRDYRKAAHYKKVREDLPHVTSYWAKRGTL
ncbi:hypothetical protein BDY19DRAFT_907142 [Irpex rosettiformis]|uniref:Uncharacterized protein n=1 Tax=Irpex rosettiformis TaxID=378272 RepID=A0ACB8U023_9APHY|nr:hypothetical protein BDY19DRAFT_907142 [Irpex rosettiformis]